MKGLTAMLTIIALLLCIIAFMALVIAAQKAELNSSRHLLDQARRRRDEYRQELARRAFSDTPSYRSHVRSALSLVDGGKR